MKVQDAIQMSQVVSMLVNAGCGTGKGGFKKGNTCQRSKGAGGGGGGGGGSGTSEGSPAEKLEAQQAEAANELTDDQVEAIASYRDNVQAAELNKALRDGRMNDEQKQMAKDLDTAIQKMPGLEEEMSVVRGISNGSMYKGLKAGDTFEEKAFTSTSLNEELIKRDFSKPGPIDPKTGISPMPVIMTIRLPAKTKSLYIGNDEGENDQWKEVLLPRGSKFRVVSSKMMSGRRNLQVELVPPQTTNSRLNLREAIEAAGITLNNCGTGKGGFKKGNACQRSKGSGGGGGGGSVPATEEPPKKKINYVIDEEDEKAVEKLGMTPKQLIDLAGAQDGSRVSVTYLGHGMIDVKTTHKDYQSGRTIKGDTIKNDYLFIEKEAQGKGLGTKILKEQVDAGAKNGFKSIVTDAEGSPHDKSMNGYYTWPRLGYDAELKDVSGGMLTKAAQTVVPGAAKVSDLMKSKEGRDWWKENGVSFRAKFDLSEGSQSRKVLDEYVKAKSKG